MNRATSALDKNAVMYGRFTGPFGKTTRGKAVPSEITGNRRHEALYEFLKDKEAYELGAF